MMESNVYMIVQPLRLLYKMREFALVAHINACIVENQKENWFQLILYSA